MEPTGGVEEQIGILLRRRAWRLAVAESCTGGLVGHRVTAVSGSSTYFLGGVIAYSNEVKERQLDVPRGLLERNGAVSDAVACAMASGVRGRFGADVGLSVTGIAGPDGGTSEKPVGLVFIGLSAPGVERASSFCFDGDREAVRSVACRTALETLRNFLRDPG
jgi:PncC family amidohydrolase